MVMIGGVGVEIGAPRLYRDEPQQSGGGELVKRVVDGGERNADAGGERLGMQLVGGHMSVAALEQEAGQGESLPRRPQSRLAQTLQHLGIGSCRRHAEQYRMPPRPITAPIRALTPARARLSRARRPCRPPG